MTTLPRFRAELPDVIPGQPDKRAGHPGRHVLQQVEHGPLEFFWISREGAQKMPPRLDARTLRWRDQVIENVSIGAHQRTDLIREAP